MERLRHRTDFLAAAGGVKVATTPFVLQALRRGVKYIGSSAMDVLVLQHIACEPPGVYEDVLRERG